MPLRRGTSRSVWSAAIRSITSSSSARSMPTRSTRASSTHCARPSETRHAARPYPRTSSPLDDCGSALTHEPLQPLGVVGLDPVDAELDEPLDLGRRVRALGDPLPG